MSEPSLVAQGLELMTFGMGVVFVFLTALVFLTTLMSTLVNKFAPEKPAVVPAAAPVSAPTQGVDPQLLKVLATAVKEHRSRQK